MRRLGFVLTSLALAVSACGSPQPCPPQQAWQPPPPPVWLPPPVPQGPPPPTVEEANAFVTMVDTDLRKLWTHSARASWIAQTYITPDSDAVSAAAEEASMEYLSRRIPEARRYAGLLLPEPTARQLRLLSLASALPAPRDAQKRERLAKISVSMTSDYGAASYCPKERTALSPQAPRAGEAPKCFTLGELSNILAKSRKPDELLEAWEGWHGAARGLRAPFQEYVALGNEGAREIGFNDLGALWRSGYDMTPEQFEAETERLWTDVAPLYKELHCYVRSRLRKKYPKNVPAGAAPIPAHLLGNMWAQEWQNVFDLVEPHAGAGSLDVTQALVSQRYDAKRMVRTAEQFFVSLGLDPLPASFWENSMLTKPKDRKVVCHASAWDVTLGNDLRIKMCIEPKEEDLITIHHELGHDYYYHSYYQLPVLFQQGANDGFHEGIGDTIALSVTPQYLGEIGLVPRAKGGKKSEKMELNFLMKMALDKIAFLPFGKLIDQWRWDVFSGKVQPGDYNKAWWELRRRYQGVAPPSPRGEDQFDPGAKYHVPANTPYTRYFLARIYQFQFHRALCKVAGHEGPLHTCSIYKSKAAGDRLKAMLALGASRPWPEAMAAITGSPLADASAMVEYFAPLRKWLQAETKGETCGW